MKPIIVDVEPVHGSHAQDNIIVSKDDLIALMNGFAVVQAKLTSEQKDKLKHILSDANKACFSFKDKLISN